MHNLSVFLHLMKAVKHPFKQLKTNDRPLKKYIYFTWYITSLNLTLRVRNVNQLLAFCCVPLLLKQITS